MAKNVYVRPKKILPGITQDILLQNTGNKMGNSFVTYSARRQ